jgi:hypothetical protein
MGSVGLLYVGAILFLNGMMLLGFVESRSAAPLNYFVGGLQVLTPTYLIIASGGDADVILGASGLYLFGFTYLYVAINLMNGLDGTGLGYFSLFVAVCAVVYAWIKFDRVGDNAFGVIWLSWAFLWGLFFLLLGRGKANLGRYTGFVAAFQGWVTGAIPAFLLLTGRWGPDTTPYAIGLAVVSVIAYVAMYPRLRGHEQPAAAVPPQPRSEPAPGRRESATGA